MCYRTPCAKCGKATWAGNIDNQLEKPHPKYTIFFTSLGCGKHIDQALAGLSPEEICQCKEPQPEKK
ncbi:hypothetical protein CLU79DRAFT_757758 [Phycomyces nitens]|nr:hypothetical protein CLU79DRAFT_757758 [Phycomyces nitens]